MNEKVTEGIFDDTTTPLDVQEDSSDVNRLSPEWPDYVMSHFAKDELVDGKPLVAGLRRVAELLIGPIVSSYPVHIDSAKESDSPGRATVSFHVQFANGTTYGEVADCWVGNTDNFVAVYPAAVASTRAEARALRKALKLKVVGADEITSKDTESIIKETVKNKAFSQATDGEFKNDTSCSDKQDSFIDRLCERAEVNREKFLKHNFDVPEGSPPSRGIASNAIDLLNKYVNNSAEIPEETRG